MPLRLAPAAPPRPVSPLGATATVLPLGIRGDAATRPSARRRRDPSRRSAAPRPVSPLGTRGAAATRLAARRRRDPSHRSAAPRPVSPLGGAATRPSQARPGDDAEADFDDTQKALVRARAEEIGYEPPEPVEAPEEAPRVNGATTYVSYGAARESYDKRSESRASSSGFGGHASSSYGPGR